MSELTLVSNQPVKTEQMLREEIKGLQFDLTINKTNHDQVIQMQRILEQSTKDYQTLQAKNTSLENEVKHLRGQLTTSKIERDVIETERDEQISESWFKVNKYKIYAMLKLQNAEDFVLVRFDKDTHECLEMLNPPSN
jgi:hypothetical protein